MSVIYVELDEGGLDLIGPLWERLNAHHRSLTMHFASVFETRTFEERKSALLKKARGGAMRVDLAKDVGSGSYIGYCVSSLIRDGADLVGEVDSIFVEKEFRAMGIGGELMRRALGWMDERGATVKKVVVMADNQEALPFYARFGLVPRNIVLEQKPK